MVRIQGQIVITTLAETYTQIAPSVSACVRIVVLIVVITQIVVMDVTTIIVMNAVTAVMGVTTIIVMNAQIVVSAVNAASVVRMVAKQKLQFPKFQLLRRKRQLLQPRRRAPQVEKAPESHGCVAHRARL